MSGTPTGTPDRAWFERNRYRSTDQFLSATAVELSSFHLSATEALALVSGAPDESGIGKFGPPVAARLGTASSGANGAIEAHNQRYEDIYGRDSLIMSRLVGHRYPELERATVEFLAQHQGVRFDESNDEEPGKILHLYRDPASPRAAARTAKSGTTWPYFGAVDTTPLFVSSALRVASRERANGNDWLARTVVDRNGQKVSYASTVERAVNWILERTEISSDKPFSFVDGEATRHYGSPPMWKDSVEAYHRSNGELAAPIIASIEVQALAYDALMDAADAADAGLLHLDSEQLRSRAEDIKAQTIKHMWMEDRGTFALGSDRVDGRYRILDVVTSNAGWLLDSRILTQPQDRRYVRGIVRSLAAPDMMSPVGIRTTSTTGPLYRPFGYHNGTVWPHDNAIIISGLQRHGALPMARKARMLVERCFRDGYFPEFVNGDSTHDQTRYSQSRVVFSCKNLVGLPEERSLIEPPQLNQGWAAATAVYLQDLNLSRPLVPEPNGL